LFSFSRFVFDHSGQVCCYADGLSAIQFILLILFYLPPACHLLLKFFVFRICFYYRNSHIKL
jgi:hypothetical protein